MAADLRVLSRRRLFGLGGMQMTDSAGQVTFMTGSVAAGYAASLTVAVAA